MKVADLDTPAIVIDLNIMERNLQRVQEYASSRGLRLRPHTKTHKIPALGRKQLQLGATGLTVAKTTEAEVMLSADPHDLLIAYPVYGPAKMQRLADLAGRTQITVALDSVAGVDALAAATEELGFEVGVLAEFDAGLHRVGVAPNGELLELVKAIASKPRLRFRGLTCYPGHIKGMQDADAALAALDRVVSEAVESVERAGFKVEIVSGGSTPTLFESHRISRLTEIRPGTYIFNDRNTWASGACGLEDCAATILATVVSTAVPGQVIIDGGSKTFSSDRASTGDPGFGYFPDLPGAVLTKMNEEHGFVDITAVGQKLRVGDRIRVLPNHICVAMNLHEQVYGLRGDRVEEVWRVEGRGKLQ
jgi:D-serine deaminase-like pyridoxal phosphate-dependent protein